MFRPILILALAFLGSGLRSGEVVLTKPSSSSSSMDPQPGHSEAGPTGAMAEAAVPSASMRKKGAVLGLYRPDRKEVRASLCSKLLDCFSCCRPAEPVTPERLWSTFLLLSGTDKVQILDEEPDLSRLAGDLYLGAHGFPGKLGDEATGGNEISIPLVIAALSDPTRGLPPDWSGTIWIGACYAGAMPAATGEEKTERASGGSVVDQVAAGLMRAGRGGITIAGPVHEALLSPGGRELYVCSPAVPEDQYKLLFQAVWHFCEGEGLSERSVTRLEQAGIDPKHRGCFRRLSRQAEAHKFLAVDHVNQLLKTTDWTAILGQPHLFLPEADAYQRVTLPSLAGGASAESKKGQ